MRPHSLVVSLAALLAGCAAAATLGACGNRTATLPGNGSP